MPAAIVTFISAVGSMVGGSLVAGSAAGAFIVGAATIVAGAAAVKYGLDQLFAIDMPDMDGSRDITTRSTVEPIKIIYGEAVVSGPVSFLGVAGTNNQDLYHAIALAGHESEAIKDVYLDGEKISESEINSGAAAGGSVGSGTFAPVGSTTPVKINKHLGTTTQTADSDLTTAFSSTYASANQGKGVTYLVSKFSLTPETQELWDKYAPSNIKALVRGRKVYDPRLEVTAGGTAGDSPTNSSYIAWSDNPALAVADYLLNDHFGMGFASSKLDWASVITAADGCDVSVSVPGSATEKRFTCNGVCYGTASHRENVDRIVSSMNGSLTYSMGFIKGLLQIA